MSAHNPLREEEVRVDADKREDAQLQLVRLHIVWANEADSNLPKPP